LTGDVQDGLVRAAPLTVGQCALWPETSGRISYWRRCSAIIFID
jgi:hypothetical protein